MNYNISLCIVKIAVIDDGIDYLHPALGGCFGAQCKVAFGYGMRRFSTLLKIKEKLSL